MFVGVVGVFEEYDGGLVVGKVFVKCVGCVSFLFINVIVY